MVFHGDYPGLDRILLNLEFSIFMVDWLVLGGGGLLQGVCHISGERSLGQITET
jgi:hypothetical protein